MLSVKRAFFGKAVLFMLCCLLNWCCSAVQAQIYYLPQDFDELGPDISGVLGKLHNPKPYLVTSIPTTYHGNQDVYAMAYFPFLQQQYKANLELELFGPNYTTAIALCSPKNPALGLYAPVEVVSEEENGNKVFAMAAMVPYNANNTNFKGPFNTQAHLNYQVPGFVNPLSSEHGITMLDGAQKFTKFSHDLLTDPNGVGWNGFDKAGNTTISCVVSPKDANSNYSNNQIFVYRNAYGDMKLTRRHIGGIITEGILAHTNGYADASTIECAEIREFFRGLLGHSYSIWQEYGNFNKPEWQWSWEKPFPADLVIPFDNPKAVELPNTYKGKFYETDPAFPDITQHNLTVCFYALHLMVDGKEGFVDDDKAQESYTVLPLIPGSRDASYKLALRILFRAFTEKLNHAATYSDLRMATLEAATEFGHGPGSHAYTQLGAAWDAVNVKGSLYNPNCITAFAETVYNGQVAFEARESTLSPSPQSQKVVELFDCANPNETSTFLIRNSKSGLFTDWDNDQVYSDINDLDQSKYGVTVHAFTQIARDWFKNKFNYDGLDGSGQFLLQNVLENIPESAAKYFLDQNGKPRAVFYYPYTPLHGSRDWISRRYMSGINHYLKYDDIKNEPVANEEWGAIYNSLMHIFSLEIKKDYERELQNPNAENIWTLYEDLADPLHKKDLSNPKLYGQPAVFKGLNWKNGLYYENNAGFMNLCYYLLAHGCINDATNTDEGYTNDEPGSLTYFINKVDRNVVLKSFWNAYVNTPANSGVEQFRMATMDALHAQGYDAKSKEHIAFYDAWAAVLGLPDYASTLKHYPEEGAVIHPWMPINEMPGMFGVEVEYITYESSRLFEVSKSATFNANEAPVYQFLNKTAPDMVTGMTYADVYLEPGQTYYVHSRLSNTGDPHLGCAETPDPAFCESLKGKKKWTVTYKIHTSEVGPVEVQNPKAGETIAAWASPFSWMGTPGADGYDLHIIDKSGSVSEQNMPFDAVYDEDNAQVPVEAVFALSKTKQYSWSVAARHKLGSPWAVHVWPNGMTYPLTDEEKAAFPNAYGNWGGVTDFATDLPTLTPGAYPADGQHVPLIGAPIILTSSSIANAGNNYNFEYKEPYKLFLNTGQPAFSMHVSNIPGIVDQQAVEWAFTPVKAATAPFILAEEKGATVWRTFIADLSLSAKPELEHGPCAFQSGVKLKWAPVVDAQGYKYSVKEFGTNLEVASGATDQAISPLITTAVSFPNPGKYTWTVSAGVKNSNNVWLYGPEGSDTYGVRPPAPINIIPDNNNGTVTLGDNHSVTFTWENGFNEHISNEHLFTLVKDVGGVNEIVQGLAASPVNGNQFVVSDLDFNSSYQWFVSNLTDLSTCKSVQSTGSFQTEDQPATFQPEVGFNFLVLAPDVLGFDVGGVTYNVTVNSPDGSTFHRMGLLSNSTNQISYDPQSNDINNGKLPALDGTYHVTVIFTEIRDYVKLQDFLPIWGITVTAMDVGPIVDNIGPAVQLDSHSKTGDFTPVVNGQLHLTFTFDSVNHTISQIQQQ
jgi:hypothetical protein